MNARELAKSYLARVADDVIAVRTAGIAAMETGIVGNDAHYRHMAETFAESATATARAFWTDMHTCQTPAKG